jgi:hypothetical protein
MTNETQRLIAARRALRRLGDRLGDQSSLPSRLRIGRFSRGREKAGETAEKLRAGRFSAGQERRPDTREKEHVSRFSEGQETTPEDAPDKRGMARYSRGVDHQEEAAAIEERRGRD